MWRTTPYVVIGLRDDADKAAIARKSKRLSGYEVHICRLAEPKQRGDKDIRPEDIEAECVTLYFCRKDALEAFIGALQTIANEWEETQ